MRVILLFDMRESLQPHHRGAEGGEVMLYRLLRKDKLGRYTIFEEIEASRIIIKEHPAGGMSLFFEVVD